MFSKKKEKGCAHRLILYEFAVEGIDEYTCIFCGARVRYVAKGKEIR